MDRNQATYFPPGVYILEEIVSRGLKLWKLMKHMDTNEEWMLDLLDGSEKIGSVEAAQLASFFGTDADLWLNLQKAWDERKRD